MIEAVETFTSEKPILACPWCKDRRLKVVQIDTRLCEALGQVTIGHECDQCSREPCLVLAEEKGKVVLYWEMDEDV